MGIKRQFQRAKIPLLVSIQRPTSSDLSIATLTDLSPGGTRFTSDIALSPGANVVIILKLPWLDLPLTLDGKVVRSLKIKESTAFEVACEFSGLSFGATQEIAKIIHIFERERRLHRLLESEGDE